MGIIMFGGILFFVRYIWGVGRVFVNWFSNEALEKEIICCNVESEQSLIMRNDCICKNNLL